MLNSWSRFLTFKLTVVLPFNRDVVAICTWNDKNVIDHNARNSTLVHFAHAYPIQVNYRSISNRGHRQIHRIFDVPSCVRQHCFVHYKPSVNIHVLERQRDVAVHWPNTLSDRFKYAYQRSQVEFPVRAFGRWSRRNVVCRRQIVL